MVRLRPYQPADLESLHGLDQVCFRPGIAYSKSELRFFLSHPRCFCLVAETEDESIAGFTIAESFLRGGHRVGHIVTIDISQAMRRQRIGSALMAGAEAELSAWGAVSVRLEVAVDNPDAQGFYRKSGYVRTGRIPGYYLGTIDGLIMEKQLA